jgi:hypothetical protein
MAAGGADGDGPIASELIGVRVSRGHGCNQNVTTRRI